MSKKIINFFIQYWKVVTTIAGAISIITVLISFDARYAKTAEVTQLDKKKTEEIKQVELNTVSTLKEFKKSIQINRDIDRLTSLNDSIMKVKILIKTYPNDKELKEDYENLKREKEKLQEQIQKNTLE